LTVTYQKYYFIDKESYQVTRIKEITLLVNDTLQLTDQQFNNFVFGVNNSSYIERLRSLQYKKILAENEFPELEINPIKVGQNLKQISYFDINEEEIQIFGQKNGPSLILFSFIGCAPCEKALKDLKLYFPKFKNDVTVFYSSFQNNNVALKKYLCKKEIPFVAFGQESNMILDFQTYFSPTFVFINSAGFVTDVLEGYDSEVNVKLLDLLLPK